MLFLLRLQMLLWLGLVPLFPRLVLQHASCRPAGCFCCSSVSCSSCESSYASHTAIPVVAASTPCALSSVTTCVVEAGRWGEGWAALQGGMGHGGARGRQGLAKQPGKWNRQARAMPPGCHWDAGSCGEAWWRQRHGIFKHDRQARAYSLPPPSSLHVADL